MTLLVTLASEATGEKTWWNPYVKGGLIAVLAVALFVGSCYLLLYTNVGSRLGFLLTASAATGFMAVLSLFWITGQFPNGPLGSESGWPVEEVVDDPTQSGIAAVRNIEATGETADPGEAGQVRAQLDVELTDNDGEFDLYGNASQFLTVQTLSKGGGRKWPMWWSEKTTYAAMEICTTKAVETLPLETPPTPECDESVPTQWVVAIKDLGARRLPAWMFFGGSTTLFVLSLIALQAYERDQREPEPADDDAETPEPATT